MLLKATTDKNIATAWQLQNLAGYFFCNVGNEPGILRTGETAKQRLYKNDDLRAKRDGDANLICIAA